MDRFDDMVKVVLKFEGGYVNNPADKGGETNYGITAATAHGAGYTGAMKDMTVDQAKAIYRKLYWEKPGFDKITDDSLAMALFDQGVNMGTGTAVKNLQQAYNYLNSEVIQVDGLLGPNTVQAVNSYKYPADLLNCLNGVRISRYLEIVENNPTQKVFLRGWLRRAFEQ